MATNTACAKPAGVTERRFARFGPGLNRSVRLPGSGSTRFGIGIRKPFPVQRQVFLV